MPTCQRGGGLAFLEEEGGQGCPLGAQTDLRVYETWGLQAKKCEPSCNPRIIRDRGSQGVGGGGQVGLAFHSPFLHNACIPQGLEALGGTEVSRQYV